MKKLTAIILILVLAQNWGRIEAFFFKPAKVQKGNATVTLYATSWCGYCKMTRQFLNAKNIKYHEYDIEKSIEGRRKYENLNVIGIPVTVVNDVVISGYNPSAILDALD